MTSISDLANHLELILTKTTLICMQEVVVRDRLKKMFLRTTLSPGRRDSALWHHSNGLVMSNCNTQDGFFNPPSHDDGFL